MESQSDAATERQGRFQPDGGADGSKRSLQKSLSVELNGADAFSKTQLAKNIESPI